VEDSVLRNVEAALSTAAADISATTASVTAVIIKLDTSIAQIKADAAAEAAAAAAAAAPAHAAAHSSSSSSMGAAGAQPPGSTGAGTTGIEGVKAPDGSVVLLPKAGSTGIIPTAGGAELEHVADQQQQQQAAAAPAAVHPAGGSSSGGGDALVRANEMARELGKALGTFGKGAAGANLSLTAGKSLEQVRGSVLRSDTRHIWLMSSTNHVLMGALQ
jgi:hypothetical protein